MFILASVAEDFHQISLRKGELIQSLADSVCVFVPGETGQWSACVKNKEMCPYLVSISIFYFLFFCLFQPTIADILNLGWWATAATW